MHRTRLKDMHDRSREGGERYTNSRDSNELKRAMRDEIRELQQQMKELRESGNIEEADALRQKLHDKVSLALSHQ